MSTQSYYFLQADYCKTMADRSTDIEAKTRWLDLAAKWLAMVETAVAQTEAFAPAVYETAVQTASN